ncbi:hypothetical protein PIB30_101868, partial [Stylosanthes scabra]|nr:hypothetical protein [Stylosanthes scabra]
YTIKRGFTDWVRVEAEVVPTEGEALMALCFLEKTDEPTKGTPMEGSLTEACETGVARRDMVDDEEVDATTISATRGGTMRRGSATRLIEVDEEWEGAAKRGSREGATRVGRED